MAALSDHFFERLHCVLKDDGLCFGGVLALLGRLL